VLAAGKVTVRRVGLEVVENLDRVDLRLDMPDTGLDDAW
jgi:hypothetical protein